MNAEDHVTLFLGELAVLDFSGHAFLHALGCGEGATIDLSLSVSILCNCGRAECEGHRGCCHEDTGCSQSLQIDEWHVQTVHVDGLRDESVNEYGSTDSVAARLLYACRPSDIPEDRGKFRLGPRRRHGHLSFKTSDQNPLR